jgi:hypothetical protein
MVALIAGTRDQQSHDEVPSGPRRTKNPKPSEPPFDPSNPRDLIKQAIRETGSRNRRIVAQKVMQLQKQYSRPGVVVLPRAQPEPFDSAVPKEIIDEIERDEAESRAAAVEAAGR